MATYKVIQDIEADDKLLGPLTARQCIYAAIGVVSCYVSYLVSINGAAFLVVFLLPFIGFGFFFAWPWSKQQSTEVWALARVRFALKPRRRIWDQNGTKKLVTVTAPVQTDPRRNNMSEREVVSRLQALANTIDSRGWAVKNVPVSLYQAPNSLSASDRLIAGQVLAGGNPGPGTFDSTDIFDVAANPLAGQLEAKMATAASNKRQQLVHALDAPAGDTGAAAAQPASNWYTPQPSAVPTVPAGNPNAADEALIARSLGQPQTPGQQPATTSVQPQPAAQITPAPASYSNIRTPQLPAAQMAAGVPAGQGNPSVQPPTAAVTPPVNPAILELANNNDLNISTIAREARQISGAHPDGTLGSPGRDQAGQGGEVSISLR